MIPYCHNIYIGTSEHFSSYSWLVFVITYTWACRGIGTVYPQREWFLIVMRYTSARRRVGTVSTNEWFLIAIPYEAARRCSRFFLVDNMPKWRCADIVELLLTLCYSIKNWRPVGTSGALSHKIFSLCDDLPMRQHILKCHSTWHSIVFSP